MLLRKFSAVLRKVYRSPLYFLGVTKNRFGEGITNVDIALRSTMKRLVQPRCFQEILYKESAVKAETKTSGSRTHKSKRDCGEN